MPGFSARDGLPHLEPKLQAVDAGVNDVVIPTDKFFSRIAANAAEGCIDFDDFSLRICKRGDGMLIERTK